jgi:hypothetical protein
MTNKSLGSIPSIISEEFRMSLSLVYRYWGEFLNSRIVCVSFLIFCFSSAVEK